MASAHGVDQFRHAGARFHAEDILHDGFAFDVAQIRRGLADITQNVGHGAHVAVGVGYLEPDIFNGGCAFGGGVGEPVHHGAHGGTGLAALDADIAENARHGGGLFHGQLEVFGAAQVLHGFAEHFQVDVGPAGGTGEDISDPCHGAFRLHIDLERPGNVGGDIRRAGQLGIVGQR